MTTQTTVAASGVGLIVKKPLSGGTTSALLLGAALTGAGFFYVLMSLVTEGHAAFNTSSEVAWGLPIAFYVFLALTSSGLTIVASLALVFGAGGFTPVVKRCIWLAIITLVSGFAVLALEVGHPFRLLWALPFSFQMRSPMWWMGVFYTIDLVLLLVKFWLMLKGDWSSSVSKAVGVASLVAVILASGTLGLVFGMMGMRPAWYDPMMPLLFIATGFLSGVALLTLLGLLLPGSGQAASVIGKDLPKVFLAAVGVALIITVARTVTGLWSNLDGMDAWSWLVGTGTYKLELWLGLVLPLILLSLPSRGTAPVLLASAAAVLIGLFFARLDLLLVGQVVPLFKGSWVHGFNHYWPSATEWALVPFGAGLVLFLYAAGEWLFDLDGQPTAKQ